MMEDWGDLGDAVLLRIQYWFRFDGDEVIRLRDNGGLDGPAVRRIAGRYGIARTIPQDGEADRAAAGLAKMINEAHWPDVLTDRAKACADIAQQAKQQGLTRKLIPSAVSKLCWFLRPSAWTVFDSFAAAGLGIPQMSSIERMLAFYDRLERRDFAMHAAKVETALTGTPFAEMCGARVLDCLMLLRGWEPNAREDNRQAARAFVRLFPDRMQAEARELAYNVAKALPQNVLQTSN